MANRFLSNIKINDAYTFPASDGTSGQVITTDGAGNLTFENASASGATLIYKDTFTGDSTTVAFTMDHSTDNEIKTQVYFDGVYQSKDNYSVNSAVITFSTAPPSGTTIEVITFATLTAGEDFNQKLSFYGKAVGDITKGDAVMFAGAQGDHFLIARATQAALEANHEYFLGLAAQDFSNNQYGYVTQFGRLEAMDTSTYTAGDILWFDSEGTTAGALTTTEPSAPNTKIQIAAVIRVHQNQGKIFVRPTIYHELGEQTDVSITSVADKDLLVWDNANGYWENSKTVDTLTANTLTATTLSGTLSTAAQTNITSVGTLSSLAVSGNLSVTGTISDSSGDTGTSGQILSSTGTGTNWIDAAAGGGTIDGSGTANYVAKWSDSDTLTNSLISDNGSTVSVGGNLAVDTNTLFVDANNNKVNIGTSANRGKLHIHDINTTANLRITNQSSGTGTSDGLDLLIGNGFSQLWYYENGYFRIATNNVERLRITSTGNVGIGTTSPAVKLDVAGQVRASTGILFGTDTAAANTLDDYEEGTWSPEIWYASSSSDQQTFNSSHPEVVSYTNNSTYVKVGASVTLYVDFTIQLSATQASALVATGGFNIKLSSLPFAPTNNYQIGGNVWFSRPTGYYNNRHYIGTVSHGYYYAPILQLNTKVSTSGGAFDHFRAGDLSSPTVANSFRGSVTMRTNT